MDTFYFYRYELVERSDNSFTLRVVFNGKHPVFDGHFPSKPVVPGVMIMQTVKECFEDIKKMKLLIETADLKFTNPVLPGDDNPLLIDLAYSRIDKEKYEVRSKGYFKEVGYFKMRLSLSEEKTSQQFME